MSGLPQIIPQQSVPISEDQKGNSQYLDINWYLFLYNLSVQVLGTGQGGGTTPASPFDFLDSANLVAGTSEIQQALKGLDNLRALIGPGIILQDPVPAAQPVQSVTVGASPFTYTALGNGTLSVTGGAVSVVSIIRQGVAVATGITTSSAGVISSLTDEKGSGGQPGFVAGVDFADGTTAALTLSQTYGSAADLWVAFDGAEQGANTYTLSGTTLTFNAPIPVGTVNVFVKGALPGAVNTSGGLVPLRRLDEVQITYTTAPTVAFLPS